MPRELRGDRASRPAPPEPKRPSALRLWLRRRKPLLRPAAKIATGLTLLGVIAVGVASFDPASRLSALTDRVTAGLGAKFGGMTVQDIRIEGARNTPQHLLRQALDVRPGDPILAFAPEAARVRLSNIPWVENVEVQRHLSGTIYVRMTERAPFAIHQNNGRFAVVDREGRIVATDRLDAFGPLPLIVGPGAERSAAPLYDMLRDQPDLLARTQALVRIGERRWNLRLHSGTDVLLPEGHEAAAIARLAELHRQNALLDRPLQTVDLRLPDRLVLRQNPAPEPAPATARTRTGARG
ncbi:cell division protein FtsQ/DivIB [Muricoccus radiodurans]|uniref:cell division protein FtsQ/DivIB n=1 Tax=Muricoccus radiodurans TaxID=2231721 RepID=UPI003CF4DDD2